jgi:hypothetical protein
MSSALSGFIPSPRLHQIDRVAVAAPPAAAWRTVRATDLYELRFVRALFELRTAPDRVGARLRGRPAPRFERTATLDQVVAGPSGFRLLAEVPGRQFVAGAIGKVWEPSIPFVHVEPGAFASFAEPGFVKVAWSLEVHPAAGGGSWVGVDVRVVPTDEAAWGRFGAYWRLIGPFSRAIRRALLRAIVKELGRPAPESSRTLPGDELLPSAAVSNTMAITIEAPPERIWPWLVQMGCRRAGWYSLDRLDNGGVPSADRIVPELQHIAVGDVLPATPRGDDGFAVLRVDPARALVLGSPSLLPRVGRPGAPAWGMFGARYDATWAFALEPIGDDATRLLVRVRGAYPPGVRMRLTRPAILAVHGIMETAQLHHLKRRAEAPA